MNTPIYSALSAFNRPRTPLGTRCITGQKCPESGKWVAQAPLSSQAALILNLGGIDPRSAPIAVNNRFPPYDGSAVYWVLVAYM